MQGIINDAVAALTPTIADAATVKRVKAQMKVRACVRACVRVCVRACV
jgi:hypothetical protein